MRITPTTIYAKGLVLIFVPLFVEVAFGISLFALQRFYTEKLAKERTAVEIIFHANEMWIACTEVLLSKANFNLFGGPKPQFDVRTNRISQEYGYLDSLIPRDSGQRKNLEEVQVTTRRILGLLDELRPVLGQQQSGSEKIKTMMSDLDILKQCQSLVDDIARQIKFFRDPEFLRSSAAGLEVERATSQVDRVVLASLLASTLVAMLLFAYFIRSINKGVQVVVDNTTRFEQGLELKAPARAGDELARVDAAFHEMADEIAEAQRTKQRIVSMISHDLRSPLTSVLGYLLNVSDGVFGDVAPATVSDAQKCEREVGGLIRLINNLLDIDKIEAGKFVIHPKEFYSGPAIARAIDSVAPMAEERGVSVAGASGTQIYADPDRIAQVTANVLSAAIRLSPRGSVIEVHSSSIEGQSEVRVINESATISAERLSSLFDRFHQGDSGLRLELPISREIIKLHGGTSGASADPNGLTLWFRLPSAAPAAPPSATSHQGA